MSLDSILENPSLKHLILDNSVRDFQGYLSGFGYHNTLETFAPEELINASVDVHSKNSKNQAAALETEKNMVSI